MEVRLLFGVAQNLRVTVAQILTCRDKKPGSAAGRVADDVLRPGRDHRTIPSAPRSTQAPSAAQYGEYRTATRYRPGPPTKSRTAVSPSDVTRAVSSTSGRGSRVTLTAVVELPRLVAGLAKGHIEKGLSKQLELLEQEASS